MTFENYLVEHFTCQTLILIIRSKVSQEMGSQTFSRLLPWINKFCRKICGTSQTFHVWLYKRHSNDISTALDCLCFEWIFTILRQDFCNNCAIIWSEIFWDCFQVWRKFTQEAIMPSTNHSRRERSLLRVIKYMYRYIKVITVATLYFLPFVRKINRTRLDTDKPVFELCEQFKKLSALAFFLLFLSLFSASLGH